MSQDWKDFLRSRIFHDFDKLLTVREYAAKQHITYCKLVNKGLSEYQQLRDAWYSWWQELDEEVNRQIEEEARHVD